MSRAFVGKTAACLHCLHEASTYENAAFFGCAALLTDRLDFDPRAAHSGRQTTFSGTKRVRNHSGLHLRVRKRTKLPKKQQLTLVFSFLPLQKGTVGSCHFNSFWTSSKQASSWIQKILCRWTLDVEYPRTTLSCCSRCRYLTTLVSERKVYFLIHMCRDV